MNVQYSMQSARAALIIQTLAAEVCEESERDFEIFCMAWFEDADFEANDDGSWHFTNRKCSKRFNVSPTRIGQIKERVARKLREKYGQELLGLLAALEDSRDSIESNFDRITGRRQS